MSTRSYPFRLRSSLVVMLAIGMLAAMVMASPSAADHLPEAGSGTLHGTEAIEDQTFVGAPCFFATTQSIYDLQGVGTYHGVTEAGDEVIYEAEIADGQTLYGDGPLEVQIENTQPYFHGPGGTHGTDSSAGCPDTAVPIPAEVRIFAEGNVYRVGQPTEPCTGQGTFARGAMEGEDNFVAEWTLDADCTVVGNVTGFEGTGIAPSGTDHTASGTHTACSGGCVDNIQINFVQYLAPASDPDPVPALELTGPASAEIGSPTTVVATLTEDGTPVTGADVTFTVGIGTASPSTGTVATDSNGQASFTFTPTGGSFATVTAAATPAGQNVSDTIFMSFTAPPPPPELTLSGTISPDVGDDATVVATLVQDGDPIPGVEVDFSVTGPGTATPSAGTATTDADGQASFTFSADTPGDYTVTATATYNGTELSDTHTVTFAEPGTFRLVDVLTAEEGDDAFASAVIDPAGDFAYFGTLGGEPSRVVRFDLNTFERVGALTLEGGEANLQAAVIDPGGEFAYFAAATDPTTVVKIDLSTFQRVGAITFEEGESYSSAAVIDPAGDFAYFATETAPGRVVKVDLNTFERVGAITFEEGENEIKSAVIDPAGDFAYFGTGTSPGRVVKVDLNTFERVGALTLEEGEDSLEAAVIDPAGDFAYFGTNTSPGRVVKIDLNAFEWVGAITLDEGEDSLQSAVIDPAGDFAYFGTFTDPGRVVQIDLVTFERAGAVIVEGTERFFSAAVDPDGEYAYFGTLDEPGKVARIALTTTAPEPDDTLTIDDTVLTNGSRGQVRGTITCEAGSLFVVNLELTQDDASAGGSTRGSCTGSPQSYTIDFVTAGPSFTDGPADACVSSRIGQAGSRTVTDSTEVCEEVAVDVQSR